MNLNPEKLYPILDEFKKSYPIREQAKGQAESYFERISRENECDIPTVVDALFNTLIVCKEKSEDGSAIFWLLWNGYSRYKDYYHEREREYQYAATLYGSNNKPGSVGMDKLKKANSDNQRQALSFVPELLSKSAKKELKKKLQTPPDTEELVCVPNEQVLPEKTHNPIMIQHQKQEASGAVKIESITVGQPKETPGDNQHSDTLEALLDRVGTSQADQDDRDKIVQHVQEIEDDYIICSYLRRQVDNQCSSGFQALLDAVVDVSGEEKLTTIYKLIAACDERDVGKNLTQYFLEYIVQLATEPDSQFRFDLFIEPLFKKGLDRSTEDFILDCCEQISELGRAGRRKAKEKEAEVEKNCAKISDSLCDYLEEPFADLETLMVNMLKQTVPAKEVARELMEKMENVYKALREFGVSPVSDFKSWSSQKPIVFDADRHYMRTQDSTPPKVTLCSLGLRSTITCACKKSIVRPVKGGDKK